uniref:Uncharacterized protein n=1 Tax=Arundo donax TaxID=35708 RepID=A0A0A8ZRI1_ARUDO
MSASPTGLLLISRSSSGPLLRLSLSLASTTF